MRIFSRVSTLLLLSLLALGAAHAERLETHIEVELRDQTGQPVQDWVNISLEGTRGRWLSNPYFPFLPIHRDAGYEAVSLYTQADANGRISEDFVGDYDGTPALSLYFGIFYSCNDPRVGTRTSGHQYSDFRTDSGATCLVRHEGEAALAAITGTHHIHMVCTLATTRDVWEQGRQRVIAEYERELAGSPTASCRLMQ